MRAADIEWSMLRGALIGLGIAVVVTIAMVGASRHFLDTRHLFDRVPVDVEERRRLPLRL